MRKKKKRTNYKDIHSDLIEACKKGNKKAQFEVYKLYSHSMFNICIRILNDSMEAEEVMQDAFLKAFQNIDSFKAEVSWGAWLKRIVINQSLDTLRKRKIIFEPLNDKIQNTVFETGDEKERYNPDDIEKIKNEIYNLPDGYRLVITLYLIEGYDHDEISEILNISPSTSRSQYSRAKQKLVENLKKIDHE
jgi:RNA polymerase sigma-70 factor, ECF subfamily